ncbi:MAG: valine--tRNA ligase [bacterium]|nr:valine--tRNA ligase [bacterium]
MDLIPKVYVPSESEQRWYEQWQRDNAFASSPSSRQPYSILMPPPNVTGILHFGHVLNVTLQDIYIRWKRLQGAESCWFPGMDHAGIATQTKVEQELKSEGKTRYDLGREAFIERTWEWKKKYGGVIDQQLRTLGASCDWDRSLFTMDASASRAVQHVFIELFDEGLIYRGKRIVNWSPVAQSALSDEEVVFREVHEQIYTMRYHLEDGSGTMLVATVRPETIFADVALAVNPNDERYTHLIGKSVIIPLRNTPIPIIADEYADPTFGTGVVKITPAHDPNDFIVGTRHNLPMPSCINPDATLNDMAGEFAGLDRFVARKRVVKALEANELLEKSEPYTHNVGFSERGDEAIEPFLSDQWFVRMESLAAPALKAVQSGDVKLHPEHWIKTYEHWMSNIRDWCISRQLWWGHRIPVYYTMDGTGFTAAASEDEARKKLNLGADVQLRQDNDVLDTWFSAWLWPLTTMGWDGTPESGKEIRDFYLPTNLLVTGPDIIFFWVARMIMATLKFDVKKRVPFTDVYFTSIIRDSKGRKLSKSLGNSPDPIGVIDRYGADAVRFTMIYLAPLGTDVRLDVDEKTQDIPSMELGRNFANKIWNVARFLQMKKSEQRDAEVRSDQEIANAILRLQYDATWLKYRYEGVYKDIKAALDDFRITEYSKLLHEFIWIDYCSIYVEKLKINLEFLEDQNERAKYLEFAFSIMENLLILLHPVMPFITEELWHGLFSKPTDVSIGNSTPHASVPTPDEGIEERYHTTGQAVLLAVVESVRRMRSELNISPSIKLPVVLEADGDVVEFLALHIPVIMSMTRANSVSINIDPPLGKYTTQVVRGVNIALEVGGTIDVEKERERLTKEIERLQVLVRGVSAKLSNEGFVAKAKPEVVEAERKKLSDWTQTIETLQRNMDAMASTPQ